jgi:hypothetical protein
MFFILYLCIRPTTWSAFARPQKPPTQARNAAIPGTLVAAGSSILSQLSSCRRELAGLKVDALLIHPSCWPGSDESITMQVELPVLKGTQN